MAAGPVVLAALVNLTLKVSVPSSNPETLIPLTSCVAEATILCR